jgi:hypothetical protein
MYCLLPWQHIPVALVLPVTMATYSNVALTEIALLESAHFLLIIAISRLPTAFRISRGLL